MKHRRRILLLLAAILAVATTTGTGGWFYQATPTWYAPPDSDPDLAKSADNQADQTLLDLVSWAAQVQAKEQRRRLNTPDGEPPIGNKTVTLNNNQIGAFLAAWSEGKVDGRLVVTDGSLIMATYSSSLHTVVSLQVDPAMDEQGMLRMNIRHLGAGRLWVPRWTVGGLLEKNRGQIETRLAQLQPLAAIDNTGTANPAAAGCVGLRILLDTLNDRSTEPFLCVPYDLGNMRHTVPVKLTEIKVEGNAVTATLGPLSEEEQSGLLARIQEPYLAGN